MKGIVRNDSHRALAGLCLLELAALVAAIGWQKAATPSEALAPGWPGNVFLTGLALAGLALVLLALLYRRADRRDRRTLAACLAANLLALMLAAVGAEVLLRTVAVRATDGVRIFTATLPRTWDETRARNREVMQSAAGTAGDWSTYVVGDPELGWTVGHDRATRDGRYFSSVEGIRSGGPGQSFAARRPPLRIALVGDSYTFSMDVSFEDSWGAELERRLGRDVQVLNFGVDGYGLDQAWLRYRRDVRPWRPDIVLFGLVQHDLQRTLAVYPFISFGWDYPFAKPRFVVEDERLHLLNEPLITPAAIVAIGDVSALPFVGYDVGYRQGDWRWRRGDPPLVVRLFGTAFRRWPATTSEVSGESAVEIGGHLLQAFLAQAAADGATARILYLPSEGAGDFGRKAPPEAKTARTMLDAWAPDHADLTSCVQAVPATERLVPGRTHYTGVANRAVARCVADDLASRGSIRAIVAGE